MTSGATWRAHISILYSADFFMQTWQIHELHLLKTIIRASAKLIARAATREGIRRPLGWVLDELFHGLAEELEARGVSRRVAADMFAMSKRTYLRKARSAADQIDTPGLSLWWLIRSALDEGAMTREQLMARFSRRPGELIASVIRDMERQQWISKNAAGGFTNQPLRGVLTTTHVQDLLMANRSMNILTDDECKAIAGLSDSEYEELVNEIERDGGTHLKITNEQGRWLAATRVVELSAEVLQGAIDGTRSNGLITMWMVELEEGESESPALGEAIEVASEVITTAYDALTPTNKLSSEHKQHVCCLFDVRGYEPGNRQTNS